MRILVVEDEERLARSIRKGLQSQPSFVVDLALDGEEGAHLALTAPFDLVILDLMLPGMDGLEILRRMRAAKVATPVLVLTARSSKEDVVRGLDLGSDDYLAKPFDMGELIARVRALVRRSHGRADPILRVGDLEVDTRSHAVRRGGPPVLLPALEYRLIELLALRAGEVVSKEEILEHLYGTNWEKFSNVVERYVSELRARIDRGHPRKLLHTLRGQGYLLGEVGA
jgi:two-component system response regulator PhoP